MKVENLNKTNSRLEKTIEEFGLILKEKETEIFQMEMKHEKKMKRIEEEKEFEFQFQEKVDELKGKTKEVMEELYQQKVKTRCYNSEINLIREILSKSQIKIFLLKLEVFRLESSKQEPRVKLEKFTQTVKFEKKTNEKFVQTEIEEINKNDEKEKEENIESSEESFSTKKESIIMCDSRFSESDISSYSPKKPSHLNQINNQTDLRKKSSVSSFETIQINKSEKKNSSKKNSNSDLTETSKSLETFSDHISDSRIESIDLQDSKEIFSLNLIKLSNQSQKKTKNRSRNSNLKNSSRNYSVTLRLDSSSGKNSSNLQSDRNFSLKQHLKGLQDIDFTSDNLFVSSKKSSNVHNYDKIVYKMPRSTLISQEENSPRTAAFLVESNRNNSSSFNEPGSFTQNLTLNNKKIINSLQFKKQFSPSKNLNFGNFTKPPKPSNIHQSLQSYHSSGQKSISKPGVFYSGKRENLKNIANLDLQSSRETSEVYSRDKNWGVKNEYGYGSFGNHEVFSRKKQIRNGSLFGNMKSDQGKNSPASLNIFHN